MTKTVNILLVEDDDIDAIAVKRAFKNEKVANPISRARDGIEALEMLRGSNEKQKINLPAILLVDINMPRMNGLEFIEEIRKDDELKRSIIFILTTSKSEEDIYSAYNLNVAGFLVKNKLGENFLEMIKLLQYYWKIVELP